MSRTETFPSATLLRFPATARRAATVTTPSRGDIERAVARGRQLQGEALRDSFRRVYRMLVDGCSLRSLRLPGEVPGQRHCGC